MLKFCKFVFLFAFLLLEFEKNSLTFVHGQVVENEVSDIYCNAEWCKEIKCSDTPLNCSTIGFRKVLSPTTCNCCEYCFNYQKEKDSCLTSLDSTSPFTHICGPQLMCQRDSVLDEDKCSTMKRSPGTCMSELEVYEKNVIEGTVGIAQFKPDCDGNGFYNPRQCMPGSICFCMSDVGDRIFGVGLPTVPMDCACARDVARMKSYGFEGSFPHCLQNGNYDELQCSVFTRTCYCLSDPEQSVAIHNIEKLPCFELDFHPAPPDTPYLRPCELARSEINFEILRVQLNGSKTMVTDQPNCGPDGNYDVIQSRDQMWICVDPSGNQIEMFEAPKIGPTPGDMDCYCAMTRFMAGSSTGKPRCCPNGNFHRWQCSGLICYCVDKLGRQDMTYKEVPLDDVDDLPCYQNPCD